MITCRVATQLLSEAQDRKLSLMEKMNLKLHLTLCQGCRNFSDQVRLLREFSKRYAQEKERRIDD